MLSRPPPTPTPSHPELCAALCGVVRVCVQGKRHFVPVMIKRLQKLGINKTEPEDLTPEEVRERRARHHTRAADQPGGQRRPMGPARSFAATARKCAHALTLQPCSNEATSWRSCIWYGVAQLRVAPRHAGR